jgi:mRNA-degrading endonuclease toxin of MazEF toxin-antitoxin module
VLSRGMVKRCPLAVAVGHRFDRRRRCVVVTSVSASDAVSV